MPGSGHVPFDTCLPEPLVGSRLRSRSADHARRGSVWIVARAGGMRAGPPCVQPVERTSRGSEAIMPPEEYGKLVACS